MTVASLLLAALALVMLRPAYLHDTRFQENVGSAWTTGVAVLGAVLAVVQLLRRRPGPLRALGAAVPVLVLALVVWVVEHDGRCVLGCDVL